ncbi:MAG: DUF4920 domain-containing protein [Proteobacteria bacterium]|nr:MAG: DUF4920 domain-containing protein [Pseudomonadota bacterium]
MRTLFLALVLSTQALAANKAETYGKFVNEKAPVVALPKAIADYKDGTSPIHTEGTVKKVCQMKGCWMTLEDQGKSVRVVFKGYSFFVGKTLEGKKVVTEGVLQKKTETVERQKHLMEDAGASKEEIAKITQPLETFQFEATAVKTI